jgi:hypothetical protein
MVKPDFVVMWECDPDNPAAISCAPERRLFARSGPRETEAHELSDRLGKGGHAFAFAPVDGCLIVVFLESKADEDASSTA